MARARTQESERDGSGPTTRRSAGVLVLSTASELGGGNTDSTRIRNCVNRLLSEYLDRAQ